MRTIKVDVTAHDIATGIRCRTDACPVALALNRATVHKWRVVGCWAENERGRRVNLPGEAIIFQDRFDRQCPSGVAPFSFAVEA